MSGRAIIQQEGGQFVNANGFTAWQGFVERGYEVRCVDWATMDAGAVAVAPEVVVAGSVRFVRAALARLGVEPRPLGYPAALAGFLGRRTWETTWAAVRAGVDGPGGPVFVKPRDHDKAFTGHVVAAFRNLIATARWPDAMPLIAAEPVAFASEWRYFVRRGAVVGVGHAKGDPLLAPDPAVVRDAVAAYAPDAPAAYGLDLGVTEGGATLLVEVNEGFALGCHGLGPLAYSAFLRERWDELVAPLLPGRGD